jgi:hypothetical protein
MKTKPRPRFLGRLSSVQIKLLCTLAGQAQAAAKLRHNPDADTDRETWRKNGQDEATGVQGLSLAKNAHQGHFLPIRGYWFTIIGNLQQAFYDFLNGGPDNEARKQMAWRLMGQIAHLSEALEARHERLRSITPGLAANTPAQAAENSWKYAAVIARDGFQGRRIEALNADELERLGFSITGRANAMQGKGDPENRNKSQRLRSKALRTASPAASEEPFKRRFSPDPDREINDELALAAEGAATEKLAREWWLT